MPDSPQATAPAAYLPSPPSELRPWLAAGTLGVAGVAVLLAVLMGAIGRSPTQAPPPVLVVASTPVAGPVSAQSTLAAVRRQSASPGSLAGAPGAGTAGPGAAAVSGPRAGESEARVAARWMEGFYPIYSTAQATFGVSWLLLASIHMQESAFSTAPSTYHGLNFAHCCGGPMQFNVTNGPVSTWGRVADSYLYGRRPASYDHRTARHPSIYDDFDSMMAAAHLLAADGAGYALEGSAWVAAYDYYGHDATGVQYADVVLARAIGWSQHGFCIGCAVQPGLIEAVHAAYGAPVLTQLLAKQTRAERTRAERTRTLRRPRRRP